MVFNHDSRKKNILRSSLFGAVSYILTMALGLGYRVFFLRILTVEYLGINGLFSNILSLLGLAELGIADAIIYRLYEPLSTEDTHRVGELMTFFRKTYCLIAAVIFSLGCAVCPFLKGLIRDSGEIPGDTNIYVVYLLLLIQTSSTYLFAYKLSLLNADQKKYQTTAISAINTLVRYTCQILVLQITKSYTVTLASGIIVTITVNWLAGKWVEKKYPHVFNVRSDLSTNEKKDIRKDTAAALLHKIGGTIVTSTDNILLSKFIGLAITGIYSNYALIISGVSGMIGSVLGSLAPSLGNAHVTLDNAARYRIFRRAFFLNLWIAGLCGCCLYNLINDFIVLWLNKNLFLDPLTVFFLCLLFYLESVRSVNISYTMSCGLFTKDRIRPVIESALNIMISIVGLKTIGTAGIFLGTILSNLCTVFWREPYLLYKYAFQQKLRNYWWIYFLNMIMTAGAALISQRLKYLLFGETISIMTWIACGIISVCVYTAIHSLFFFRSDDYRYFIHLKFREAMKRSRNHG